MAAGVVDLPAEARADLVKLLTFEELPDQALVTERAVAIARMAAERFQLAAYSRPAAPDAVMVGGVPFLMAPLERALAFEGLCPVYAFSRRESAEEPQPDGSVRKVNIFRHAGFVPA